MRIPKEFEPLPFYEDPIIIEVAVYMFLMLMMVFIIRMAAFFNRGGWLTDSDPLNFKNRNRIVSPFLIKEQVSGDVIVQYGGKQRALRVFALFLIVIFVSIPLSELMNDSNFIISSLWY
ncbi:MAG: hypothetical protein Aureis2KO_05850 [Aureisphaera sp.]